MQVGYGTRRSVTVTQVSVRLTHHRFSLPQGPSVLIGSRNQLGMDRLIGAGQTSTPGGTKVQGKEGA